MTDTHDLVARAQGGDEEARRRLFARVEASVLRIVRRRMGRRLRAREESVDVVQSVLAEALQGLERFEDRGERALMRWLTRVIENKLRKRARAMGHGDRDPDRVRPVAAGTTNTPGLEPDDEHEGARTIADRQEEMERLRRALARLPERERRLIELRDIQELSWRQVLERSGEVSEKAAQNCHARARVRLLGLLHLDRDSS